MDMDPEGTVTEPEDKQEEVKPASTEEVKPAASEETKPAEASEVKPAEEKVIDAESKAKLEAVEAPVTTEEPKPEATPVEEAKPDSKAKPEEPAAMVTPSVVKDIPSSKLPEEALATKDVEKPVSSTNTLEKDYHAEVNKESFEQIQS